MADDVLINKSAIIERCVRRAREEYAAEDRPQRPVFLRIRQEVQELPRRELRPR